MAADGTLARATPLSAPHNLEAEQGLLGALLFDNENANRITDKLKAHHFYDPVHGRIFSTIQSFVGAGKLADGVTLREHFQRDGALKEIGGAAYLLTLLEHAARLSVHAQEYAELIYELALRRELIRVGQEIAALAESPPEGADAEDIIEESERALFSLAESGTSGKGFYAFSDALTTSIEMAAAAYESDGHVSGLSTGLRDLDEMLGGLHPSDLVIIAGRPSMGKTAFATQIAFNVAEARRRAIADGVENPEKYGGIVAFFSLEMSGEQLATRLLSQAASVPADDIRKGKIGKAGYEVLVQKSAELNSLPMHIDETGGISITQLSARARRLQRSIGLDLVVVDYLQLVTAAQRRSEGRVQEVSEITQGLKALAKELKVPVIALSQLSRQVESREDKRPMLSDLRESGSIEQDADVVMFVYREAYYLERALRDKSEQGVENQRSLDALRSTAEIIIGKQRHGPIGKVELHYDGQYAYFADRERRHPDASYR
ncbi:MAG: replicative DNA helicase [Hydrogenophilaceae bacterium]|jgi:replicative DNA helicase|nr:replicative DNA helicase [Hydrogenophilaceae bacterium]